MTEELPKEVQSFWRETAKTPHYPKLDQNIETDVVVVGGGIAGILSAYTLAKEGKSVALIEGRNFFGGTTGYTTAKLTAQHQLIYDELINRYGQDTAKRFYQANMEGIAYIKQIADEHNINCDLCEQDAFVYTQDKNQLETFAKEADAYNKLGIHGGLLHDLPINLDVAVAIQMEKQAEFQPAQFLNGVLKALEQLNVQIYENTMVVDIEQNDKLTLKTATANTITCKNAILATHYPSFEPDKHYTSMKPEISYALAFKAPIEYPDGMYINQDMPKRTFRKMQSNGEGYLLVGGQSHQIGDEKSELDRYKDIYHFAREAFDVTDVAFRWSAHDLITNDRVPFVGELHPDYPNVFTATGFSKWGLAVGATSAKVLTDAILGRDNVYSEMFKPRREIPDLTETNPKQEQVKDDIDKVNLDKSPDDLQNNEATVLEKDDKNIGVFKDDNGKLHYLNISCTHMGCDVNWNNGDQTWDCPCHGSRFKATGEVIEGPAVKDLAKED